MREKFAQQSFLLFGFDSGDLLRNDSPLFIYFGISLHRSFAKFGDVKRDVVKDSFVDNVDARDGEGQARDNAINKQLPTSTTTQDCVTFPLSLFLSAIPSYVRSSRSLGEVIRLTMQLV